MKLANALKHDIKRAVRLLPLGRRWSRLAAANNEPSTAWYASRFLIASSKKHAFLDRGWIAGLFRLTPSPWRRALALHLLSLSPHYWVYQWSHRYSQKSRRETLELECERNARSRQEIASKLLAKFLRPAMKVLDFGCGPGFLARMASPMVGHLIATDVSRGVLACAKAINFADNITYVRNEHADLRFIEDKSLDLVYSFAVFQHLLKGQAAAFFQEFRRILRPGNQLVCHTILKEEGEDRLPDPSAGSWIQQRVMLRMVYYTKKEMADTLRNAGFAKVDIVPISELANLDDDIGGEHLIVATK